MDSMIIIANTTMMMGLRKMLFKQRTKTGYNHIIKRVELCVWFNNEMNE